MRILRTTGAILAATVLTFIAPTSVSTATGGAGATLHLSWSAPEISHQVFTATLTCFPNNSTGDYHDADAACSEISTVGGDFASLPGWWFMNCTNYQGWKIRTTATGTWQGQPVNHDVLHANICEARKATGSVFLF